MPIHARRTLQREMLASFAGAAVALLTVCIPAPSAAELKRLLFHSQIDVARVDHFVAAEAFKLGSVIGGRVLGSISVNFERQFLTAIEYNTPAVSLQVWTLRYSADDVSLIETVGGEERALLSLSSIYHLMQMGEDGGNHIDWRSNVAFSMTSDGKVWAIHWSVNRAGEWVIGAAQVPHPAMDWPSGCRVFVQTGRQT